MVNGFGWEPVKLTHDPREPLICPWNANMWLNFKKHTFLGSYIHSS